MNKRDETKIKKAIKDTIGDNYCESDSLIINQLIDYLKMDEQAKYQLATEAENGAMQWTTVSTIAMVTKNINMLINSLGITPKDRLKLKALIQDKKEFNLKEFLADEN